MQKIATHLWFDQAAREAAEFYVSLFPNSRILSRGNLTDTPSGSVETVTFELLGRELQAISAGPVFQFNPSVSFHILCNTPEDVDTLWARLLPGGEALVDLGSYPFSERFGWVQDKYGLSWQIFYGGPGDKMKLTPVIMFVGPVSGRAEEAVRYWTSVFPNSAVDMVQHYGPDELPDPEGTVRYAAFNLFGQEFGAMDSAQPHQFGFNEAISFIVKCDTQEEIDTYWNRLSAVPEAEQCGWLKDKFGVSWQIVPRQLEEMMSSSDPARVNRVTQAFLPMKKLDIAELEAAYAGE